MCLQLKSRAPWRWCLIMAALVFGVVVILVLAVLAFSRPSKDGCFDNLQCLPINECENYINPDFVFGCGNHESPRICCVSKTHNVTDEHRLAQRIEKMKLFPEVCGISTTTNKVANGVDAALGQFPWIAILGYKARNNPNEEFLCGGTIINNRYILTAAHCTNIKNQNLSSVTLGELNLETDLDCESEGEEKYCADKPIYMGIESIMVHPAFNRTSLKNDIALLRLDKEIPKFSEYVQPVCLPFGLKVDDEYFKETNFTIAGWGKTTSSSFGVASVLQYTTVSTWSQDDCSKALYGPVTPVNHLQVCATGKNLQEACRGDSGGPLTDLHRTDNGLDLKNTQIGVVSFKSFDTCGTEDIPTVFTRVDKYLDWIVDNIQP